MHRVEQELDTNLYKQLQQAEAKIISAKTLAKAQGKTDLAAELSMVQKFLYTEQMILLTEAGAKLNKGV